MLSSLIVLAFLPLLFALLARPSWRKNNDDVLKLLRTDLDDGVDTPPPRVLLLTAHPDDECMFFAPTVQALVEHGNKLPPTDTDRLEVYSLCLSIGNADGLGSVRRHELDRSLDILGIQEGHRWVEDKSALQDNFTAQWDHQVIADVIMPYVINNNITTILTFDDYGISGHPNHYSLPRGVVHLISSLSVTSSPTNGSALPSIPRLFALVSMPLLSKYTGPLSLLLVPLQRALNGMLLSNSEHNTVTTGQHDAGPSRVVFISGAAEYATALRAMRQHRSQLVWFRWLYVTFSRYMWVNDWVEAVPRG
ncbi:LmbE-like protein [Laetiporus sulphureus 93-53]|uniref:N-acetylglucosaminylphosphatidylinositol deacetylase n=1 Tax=Laetiporus sulphureus 93-53 TaxID=1314785 RepID=A0A165DBT8_9APHY|nr:LmbE-like protein [Laetiporus sulphureus 93-53]KZT04513.1 LmbE-like protein [Laetiporus sulphureus 93-53]